MGASGSSKQAGTLVMPAFNFDFCESKPFDRENSPAQTGALSEAFRLTECADALGRRRFTVSRRRGRGRRHWRR